MLCQDLVGTRLSGFFPATFPNASHLSVVSENAVVVPGDILFPDSVLTFLEINFAKGSN